MIALSWIAGNLVGELDKQLGLNISFIRPLIDGTILYFILKRGWSPNYGGALLYSAVAGMLVIQLLTRLTYTALQKANPSQYDALWYQKDLALNIEFLFILAFVWVYAIPKSIIALKRPESENRPHDLRTHQRTQLIAPRFARDVNQEPDIISVRKPSMNGTAHAATVEDLEKMETEKPVRSKTPFQDWLRQLFNEIAKDD